MRAQRRWMLIPIYRAGRSPAGNHPKGRDVTAHLCCFEAAQTAAESSCIRAYKLQLKDIAPS